MKIVELFRRDIHRTIEEVVKVDLADEAVIANELDEYVATDHILEEFEAVLDAYQESINSPNESCTIWVSGFFGSGKSSWAKVLGYLLSNPTVAGSSVVVRFFERTNAPRLRSLLSTIHAQAPTLSVLLNLATGSNVAREGESVVLPAYRALLERLGYSRNFLLAELEFTLKETVAWQTSRNCSPRQRASSGANGASRSLQERGQPGAAPPRPEHLLTAGLVGEDSSGARDRRRLVCRAGITASRASGRRRDPAGIRRGRGRPVRRALDPPDARSPRLR